MRLGEDRGYNRVSIFTSYFDKFHGVRNNIGSSPNSRN